MNNSLRKRLHWFFPVQVKTPEGLGVATGITGSKETKQLVIVDFGSKDAENYKREFFEYKDIQPILIDVNQTAIGSNESLELFTTIGVSVTGETLFSSGFRASLFADLIDSKVDVFGWIPEGIALRKKIKPSNNLEPVK